MSTTRPACERSITCYKIGLIFTFVLRRSTSKRHVSKPRSRLRLDEISHSPVYRPSTRITRAAFAEFVRIATFQSRAATVFSLVRCKRDALSNAYSRSQCLPLPAPPLPLPPVDVGVSRRRKSAPTCDAGCTTETYDGEQSQGKRNALSIAARNSLQQHFKSGKRRS